VRKMNEKKIKKIVAFELGVDEKNVTLWSSFEKLKADKQDRWETIVAVEDTLKKSIPDGDFKKLCRPETTVGELMKYANSHT
jgi:acyl carrier protein